MKTYFKAIMNSIIHIFNLHVNFCVICLSESYPFAEHNINMKWWFDMVVGPPAL